MIFFLNYMSKQFGENPMLGEGFMTAITDQQFTKLSLHPHVKCALVVTNCTTERVIDGVAKLITKTDITGLKAKRYESNIAEVEEQLSSAWKTLAAHTTLQDHQRYKLFGMYCIRFALWLTNKQKAGRENVEYKLVDLKDMLKKDLQNPGVGCTSQPAASTSTQSKKSTQAYELQDAGSPMFLAKQPLKLEVGCHYTIKGHGNKIFTINVISQDQVTLSHTEFLTGTSTSLTFPATDILDNFKVTKAKPPTAISDQQLAFLFPSASASCMDEMQKAQVYILPQQMYNEKDLDESHILVQTTQNAVYNKKECKKGFIEMVPVAEKLSNITTKQPAGSRYGECALGGTTFFVTGPWALKYDQDQDSWSGAFAPFWACNKEDTDGNLDYKWVKYDGFTEGNFQVKVLTNKDVIPEHQLLSLKKVSQDVVAPAPKKARK